MKNSTLKLSFAGIFIIALAFVGNMFAQTAGTLTFSFTTAFSGGFSPKHIIAIWIEDSSAKWVKTKLINAKDQIYLLPVWAGKSQSNTVDATTGATAPLHSKRTIIWNGTNVAGNLVADGAYKVWVELAWGNNTETEKKSTSYSFTKGANSFTSAPANTSNFTSITLDWTPIITSAEDISQNSDIAVYPNPTNGLINVDFKKSIS